MRRHPAVFCLVLMILFAAACSPTEVEKAKETPSEPAKAEPPSTPPAPTPTPPPAPAPAPAANKEALTGTWVINLAKSKYSPADIAPKSGTSTIELTADGVHVIAEGVDFRGRKTRQEYTAKFGGPAVPNKATIDGKPNPTADTDVQAWKKIDDYTFENTGSLKGKPVMTTKVVVARDGKSRTNTQTGTNTAGQAVNHTVYYDKQ